MYKLIFCILITASPVFAQRALYDSVRTSIVHRPLKEQFDVMEEYADSLLSKPYDALPFTEEAIRLSQQLGDKREQGYLLNSLSRIYQSIGEFDLSSDNVRKALALNREVSNTYEVARGYSIIATTYYYMGLYNNSMEFNLKALALFQQLKKPAQSSVIMNSIGSIYLRLSQYDTSAVYFRRALAMNPRKDTTVFKIHIYTNIAFLQALKGQPDSALQELNHLLSIARRRSEAGAEAYILFCIGSAHLAGGRYDEALRRLEQARAASVVLHEAHGAAEAMIAIAAAYEKKGNYADALSVLDGAIAYCRRVKTYDLLLASLKLRWQAYNKLGEMKKAFASLKDYSQLADSVSALSERIGVANAAYSFDVAKREEEIARLKKDAINDENSIRQQQLLIYSLAGLMMIVIAASLGLVFMYRKANRLHRTEVDQKKKIELLYSQLMKEMEERKTADEQARESEHRFRSIWEMSNDGMRLTDQNGTIIMVNEAFCRMVGMTREELEGQPLSVLYRPSAGERVDSIYRQRFNSRTIEPTFERQLYLKNGRNIWFEVTNTYIAAGEQPVLLLGIFRDITQRRKLEHQLVQAQKLEGIGTLAGGIAHDFNNLLAMILGSAELLQSRLPQQPELQKFVDRIVQASIRGTSISRQLLMFSRPDQAEFKPISLSKTVTDLRELLSHFLPKSIRIEMTIEPERDMIIGDAGQIQQAMLNLAINAGDAMKGTGTLTIREYAAPSSAIAARFAAPEQASYVALSITDTGIGMDEAVKAKIFDPFFTTKERNKGTGLGLSSVHGIVKNHGGMIDCESAPGKGSTFTLYFPCIGSDLHAAEQEAPEVKDEPHTTILLVDDELVIRETMQECLTASGYTVLASSSGREALEVYRSRGQSIDLVLTDLGMPEMGGEELCRQLLKIDPSVAIIVSSGYLDGTTREELLDLGVFEVISKPARIGDIQSAIRKVLSAV
ncbi:MAG: PAS domain S-box protein [Acidobacteriota bacterium]